jgi:hypothetical protein
VSNKEKLEEWVERRKNPNPKQLGKVNQSNFVWSNNLAHQSKKCTFGQAGENAE